MVKMDTMGPPEGTEETVKMAKMVLNGHENLPPRIFQQGSISMFHFICCYSRKSNPEEGRGGWVGRTEKWQELFYLKNG